MVNGTLGSKRVGELLKIVSIPVSVLISSVEVDAVVKNTVKSQEGRNGASNKKTPEAKKKNKKKKKKKFFLEIINF